MAESRFLIVLGAGPQQQQVYKTASQLGIKTVALDFNAQAMARDDADRFLLASIKDKDECISALRESGLDFCGVVTCGAEVAPQVSAIADVFGLRAVSQDTARRTTHKKDRYDALSAAGIAIPNYCSLSKFGRPCLDYPFVVKPPDNAGSRGVRMVRNSDEWPKAFKEAWDHSSDGTVIIEQLLKGDELSIEGFVLDGKMHVYGLADRNYLRDGTFDPYFMEDGSSSPSQLGDAVVAEAIRVFEQAAKSLGIEEGPSKGDLIVTDKGVHVLEITSRLSPGFSQVGPTIFGMNPLENVILWATGQQVSEQQLDPPFQRAMAHRYYHHEPGRVTAVRGLDTLAQQPGVVTAMILNDVKVGDILTPASYINRVCYVFTHGDTVSQAIELAQTALLTIQIEVQPLEAAG